MKDRVRIYAVVLILILIFPPMQFEHGDNDTSTSFRGYHAFFEFPPFVWDHEAPPYNIHMPMFLTEIACATLVLAASFIADKRQKS